MQFERLVDGINEEDINGRNHTKHIYNCENTK
jgi:hypothetical protein